jgi:LysR family hydrogen peroxide-inducible transcriptional activator
MGEKYPSLSLQTEEMLSSTIKDKLRKAEVDMGILTGPVPETDLLEIPLYHERFLAYVSPGNPSYAQESIRMNTLFKQPVWIIRDGLRQLDPGELKEGEISYERLFEGGHVGILIQVVNDNGGLTIIPETHSHLIMYSQQTCLRPIIDPVPGRTISLVIRNDYIHEAKLNAVVTAIKRTIPGHMLDSVVRKDYLEL